MSVWYRKPTFSTAWSPSSWRSERNATPRPRDSGGDGEAGCATADLTAHADLTTVGAGLPGGNLYPFDKPVRRSERVFGVCLALGTEGGADLRIKHCLDTDRKSARLNSSHANT